MRGHGEKFTRKQEAAIIALLNATTIVEASKIVRVGEATLWRWLQDEKFQQAYQEAKRKALSIAIGKLQQATGEAVETLRTVAIDKEAPCSARVSAARTILELGLKARETEEFEQRLSELEKSVKGGIK